MFHQVRVKSVISGDTLIVSSVHDPSEEKSISLAFVGCPRFSRDKEEVSCSKYCKYPASSYVSNMLTGRTSSPLHSSPEISCAVL